MIITTKFMGQYFPVTQTALFVWFFESVSENPKVRATETYVTLFHVLFLFCDSVVLTFELVNEIPRCDHSNESY